MRLSKCMHGNRVTVTAEPAGTVTAEPAGTSVAVATLLSSSCVLTLDCGPTRWSSGPSAGRAASRSRRSSLSPSTQVCAAVPPPLSGRAAAVPGHEHGLCRGQDPCRHHPAALRRCARARSAGPGQQFGRLTDRPKAHVCCDADAAAVGRAAVHLRAPIA